MIEESETAIKPPSSPITVKINMAIMQYYFDYFVKKYLPSFKTTITSSFRESQKNKEVGGVENSAHLHGLAYDFILRYPNNEIVPKAQAKKVFDEFIKPNWPGFALWEEDHIHVNLSRKITEYASIMGIAAMGVIGIEIIKSLGDTK